MTNRTSRLSNLFKLLPQQLPQGFLYGAMMVAFLLVVFFDSRYSKVTFPVSWRLPFLDFLTYLLDPSMLQLLGLLLFCYLAWRYLARTHPGESATVRFALCSGLPILLVLITLMLEQLVLKPTFQYPRPTAEALPLGGPWLTAWLRAALQWITEQLPWLPLGAFFVGEKNVQDVPSGFVLRQMALFYLTVWVAEQQQPEGAAWLPRSQRFLVHITNSVLLGLVMFSRVYRANHTVFAVTVAVGIGTLLFWSFMAVLYSSSAEHRRQYRSLLAETIAAYLAFVLPFFMYANDAGRLLAFSLIFLLLLSFAYVLPSHRGDNQWNHSS